MIDLHLHTTASDGRLRPKELVNWASIAGLTVMAVTDHDTTAAVAEVRREAESRGILAIAGIEITAVEDSRDVHMLGYFFDPEHADLTAFLVKQRDIRVTRAEVIAQRLAELGMPIDVRAVLRSGRRGAGGSTGRPQIAQAMVAAGHTADIQEAFDRWLGEGRPAFVPRTGATPQSVIAIVHAAQGLVSLAHPGRTRIDERIPQLYEAGLDAIEVYHPDHTPALEAKYEKLAGDLGCLVTGGSDFHGDTTHGLSPGSTVLPHPEWERLVAARGARG